MKTLTNLFILVLIVSAGLSSVLAQTTKKDKKVDKGQQIKMLVETKKYTFQANYVLPQRGGSRQLTTEYDFRVTPDSIISFLPYFGRAYFDVPYGGDAGIKFTSTKFTYDVKEKKKGGWEITIRPSDVKYIDRLTLYISPDGYASLSVNSINKDFIDYNGYLK